MEVRLFAHSQLTKERKEALKDIFSAYDVTDGQIIALTAIRTCYSHLKPTEIVSREAKRYFGQKATDGKGGTEADRLFRHIMSSGHTSTLEHISFTFTIEGVSRSLLAQLTRHRVGWSYSAQSQRYVRMGSGDRSQGFDYTIPPTITEKKDALDVFKRHMHYTQEVYDTLRDLKVPAEDARYVLPNAAQCNIVVTSNLTALLSLYSKRQKGRGAQWEIGDMVEQVLEEVIMHEPWSLKFFDEV